MALVRLSACLTPRVLQLAYHELFLSLCLVNLIVTGEKYIGMN